MAIAFYDARLSDQNARMVESLKASNLALVERTHRAERLTTELRASEDSLRQFRTAMETSPDVIFLVDCASMRYVDVNNTACVLLGYSREELLRMGPAELNAHSTRQEMEGAFDRTIALGNEGRPSTAERRELRRKDGATFPIEVRRKALRSGEHVIIVAVAHDITDRKRVEQTLNEANEQLRTGLQALERRNGEITLLAELSNFLISCVTIEEACHAIPKYCRTLFPEEQGALYLFRASRDYLNLHASWGGGEELVIVLPDSSREGAIAHAKRILDSVRNLHVVHNDRTLGPVTISIGLAMYPQNGNTVKAVLKSADKALYEAKGAGRDRLVVAAA